MRALAERLAAGGMHDPADRFARLHDELAAEPEADRLLQILREIRDSSRVASEQGFDLDARRAYAAMWACARETLAGMEAG